MRAIPPEDRETVRALLERMEHSLPGLAHRGRCTIRIESDVVRGAGFGSSAALCGALARASVAHAADNDGMDRTVREWTIAHGAETLFHGTPSGVDTGLALLGGMCVFQPRPPGLPAFRMVGLKRLHIVTGAVARDAACGALIGALAARLRSAEAAARAAIDDLGGIAGRAAEALEAGVPGIDERIGILADAAMDRLRGLGLSTPLLDRLLRAGKEQGAFGGKLSGAGAGGAFFLVVRDDDAGARVAGALEAEAASAGQRFLSPPRLLRV